MERVACFMCGKEGTRNEIRWSLTLHDRSEIVGVSLNDFKNIPFCSMECLRLWAGAAK